MKFENTDFLNTHLRFCNIGGDILPQKIFGLLNFHPLPSVNFTMNTNKGYFDSRLCDCSAHRLDGKYLLEYTLQDSILLHIIWGYSNEVIIRTDTVINNSGTDIVLYDYKARICFKGEYEMYSQLDYWCYENQGRWEDILHGEKSIQSQGGRTCIGASPYACLREKNTGNGIVVHLVPKSDWKMSVEGLRIGSESPHITIESGFRDPGLSYPIKSTDCVLLSELILTDLPDGKPEAAAPILHTYLLQHPDYQWNKTIPIEFNTWIFEFDQLNEEHLLQQLKIAKEIGCEVFTIDAGWYGQSEGNWIAQIGDWREKQNGAFYGNMRQFADKVRKAGLKFGLWIEPERYSRNVPIVCEHPEWFIDEGTEHVYPDLQQEAVYHYIYGIICDIVDRYDAEWIKWDFNNVLGRDLYGMAHAGYLDRLYKIMDNLRQKYPQVTFENCASGGMRLELESFKHYDIFFSTDNTNPIDMLRVCEGAALRLIPGRILKWLTLKNLGPVLPIYSDEGLKPTVITPGRGGWPPAETVDLDFAAKISLCGQLSFSGDIGSFNASIIAAMKRYVSFAKDWRNFIYNSVAFPLTEAKSIDDRKGFSAIMLTDLKREKVLIFAYRLDSSVEEYCVKLPSIERTAVYRLECFDKGYKGEFDGEALLRQGLDLRFEQKNSGQILILKKLEH